jgi:hypothetical protein
VKHLIIIPGKSTKRMKKKKGNGVQTATIMRKIKNWRGKKQKPTKEAKVHIQV